MAARPRRQSRSGPGGRVSREGGSAGGRGRGRAAAVSPARRAGARRGCPEGISCSSSFAPGAGGPGAVWQPGCEAWGRRCHPGKQQGGRRAAAAGSGDGMSDAETAGAASPVTCATHASLTVGAGTEPRATAVRSRPARFPEERQEAVRKGGGRGGRRRRLPAQRTLGAKMAPRCARAGIAFSFPFSFPYPPPLPPPPEPSQAPPCRSARPSGWASSHRRNPRPPGRSGASSGAARTGRAGPHRGRRGAGGSAGSAAPR